MNAGMSVRQFVVVIVSLATVGLASALAGTAIVVLTGSEEITPVAGGVLGAALGVSAGTVVNRVLSRKRTLLDVVVQVGAAGGMAAATLWYLQNR